MYFDAQALRLIRSIEERTLIQIVDLLGVLCNPLKGLVTDTFRRSAFHWNGALVN